MFCSADGADDERRRNEIVGAMRACAFAARSKQNSWLYNKHDPEQSMIVHDPSCIVNSTTNIYGTLELFQDLRSYRFSEG